LKFKPAADVIVSVTSLKGTVATATPGTLTFTPANYNVPQLVTVSGVHDNNLATDMTSIELAQAAIGTTDVMVSVADVDTQQFVVSKTSLIVQEGTTGTFDVSLKFDPGTTVTTMIISDNVASLPVSPGSLTFTGGMNGNWPTPMHVNVNPPVDTNAKAETATITVHGAGAPDAIVTATVIDPTVVKQYGFFTPFTGSSSVLLGEVIAYRITVDATTNLDSFGVFIPAGTGDFRMALYADGSNAPGALVAQMPVRQAIVGGVNTGDIPDVNISIGTYWIAFRVAQTTAVGFSTVGTGPVCIRNIDIPNLDTLWPATFGNATCSVDNLMNFFITTYHQ
jgi:hypothetical protein